MSSKKKSTTKRFSVTIHLTVGKDDSLINWCRNIQHGKRMSVLKDALAQFLGTVENISDNTGSELAELRTTTADIQRLVKSIDQRLKEVKFERIVESTNPAAPLAQLSSADVVQRQQNMNKHKW